MNVAVRMLAALGMALSMLTALAVTASAAPNPGPGAEATWDNDTLPTQELRWNEVYFPAVGNADASTGLGDAQTSITVQNIEADDAYLFIFVGMPEDDDGVDLDNWDFVEYAYISGGASKTFQASDLEIPAGEVRPVIVFAYNALGITESGNPIAIAGVAKQAVGGDSLPYTTTADSVVSGYNAVSGLEMGYFDQLYFPVVQTNCGPGGCWNSILRVSNMGLDDNAAVTVRFFPADDGSGSLQTGFQLQSLVDVGETWSIDLSEWVPDGWVGSAHVYTDDAVGAIVDRVKVGTDMWITNTASNATAESEYQVPGAGSYPYVLLAPDVRTDYNGWNTGINVANTVPSETNVSIQYFGNNGNAPAAQTRRLAAHGMTYFYNPSNPTEDRCDQPANDPAGCEFIGGAIILSSNPVAVAVDGVKYFGNDANVGQAFSYAATGNAFDELSAPLVQKGNPANGMGATSGINFLNPNPAAATVETTWLNPSGFGAANFGSSIVWVPAFSTGFVYTMFHNNLPNGYVGSAVVESTLPVAATTANVDYQVGGDGTAIWNLVNPCGFFRQSGECVYESPLEPLPTSATLTKEVLVDNPFDELDVLEPLSGVLVSYEGVDDNGFPVSGAGLTGENGEVTFAVPAGIYDLDLVALPDAPVGYAFDGPLADDNIAVPANDAITVTNVLTLVIADGTGILTKQIENLPVEYTSLESEVYFCPVLDDTSMSAFADCVDSAIVSAGYGEQGMATDEVSANVPAGVYTICTAVSVWVDVDLDGNVDINEDINDNGILDDGEDVDGDLLLDGGEVILSGGCESTDPVTGEPIIVFADEETVVVNDFEVTTGGVLDVNVRDDEDDAPIEGAQVCVYPFGALDVTPLCGLTDEFGDVEFRVPAGTHTVSIAAADHEQESAVVAYSPAVDVANGGDDDYGLDADVIVALDPIED